MPKVGKKHFAYTPKGKAAAKPKAKTAARVGTSDPSTSPHHTAGGDRPPAVRNDADHAAGVGA